MTPPRDARAAPPLWRDLLYNFLPGLLAGTQIAALLFFLNPHLPFALQPLLRGILLFGGSLGLATAALLTPFTRRRPGRAGRLLPWTVTVVLALAALGDWVHASYFAFFIPPGINVRLIKAALWLTLAALIFFYTALLHSIHRRPYGLRSRVGLSLLAIVSVGLLVERREAFKPPVVPPPLPSAIETEARPSLFVVGIQGATLDAILPLARQGHLPFFASMMERGAYGRLRSLAPNYDGALWTTVATGKLPYVHGVLHDAVFPAGFLSPGDDLRLLPAGLGLPLGRRLGIPERRADATVRESLAIWEILSRLGVPAGSVGWPSTYGSSANLLFSFSERYFGGDILAASALPLELAERGVLFEVAPEEIDARALGQLDTEVPHALLRTLAADLWRESLTLFLIDQKRELKALFLMLPGLGPVSKSYYGGYSAVQFGGAQDRRQRQAAELVVAYYRHLDQFLARLYERQGGSGVFAVVSAYGFEAPEGLRRLWGTIVRRPLEGSSRDSPDGVVMLRGDGIERGRFLDDARLIDVMPTLLYGLRLPIALDLDGRILTQAFERQFLDRQPLTFVPSYETLAPEEREGGAGIRRP